MTTKTKPLIAERSTRIGWFGRFENGLTPMLATFPPLEVHYGTTRVFQFEGTEFTFQFELDVPDHLAIAYANEYMGWYAKWVRP